MGKNKELAKNTAIIMFGKMCTQFLSFFLLPLYTALLSTEEYGTFDYIITIVSLCIPIVFWQIEDAMFRFLVECRDNEEKKEEVISAAFNFVFRHILVATILYAFAYCVLNFQYKVFLYTNVICTYLSTLSLQTARGLGKNVIYSMGSFISASVTVVCNVIFIVVFGMRADGMLLALCVGNIMCFVYVFFTTRLYRYIRWKNTNLKKLKKMLGYSLPMIPNLLAWTVISTSDRLVLTTVLGAGATGIYSVANKFPSLFSTIYNIFNVSWTESAALHLKDKDGEKFVSNVINSMFSFFAAIAIGIIACMPFAFPILVNSNYRDAYAQIPILILATMFNVIVGLYSVVYIALKQTGQIAKSSVFAAIVNVIVNIGLIQYIGIFAASVSTLVAYMVLAIYRYYDLKKYVHVSLEKKRIISAISIGIVVCVCYYVNNVALSLFGLVVSIIFAFFSNKTIVLGIVNTGKNKIVEVWRVRFK